MVVEGKLVVGPARRRGASLTPATVGLALEKLLSRPAALLLRVALEATVVRLGVLAALAHARLQARWARCLVASALAA